MLYFFSLFAPSLWLAICRIQLIFLVIVFLWFHLRSVRLHIYKSYMCVLRYSILWWVTSNSMQSHDFHEISSNISDESGTARNLQESTKNTNVTEKRIQQQLSKPTRWKSSYLSIHIQSKSSHVKHRATGWTREHYIYIYAFLSHFFLPKLIFFYDSR